MATRDLTKEYLDIRASVIRKRNQKLSSTLNNNGSISTLASITSSGSNNTPTNGYRKLAAGGGHDLMLSEHGDDNNNGYSDIEMNTLTSGSGKNTTTMTSSSIKKPDWVNDVGTIENCINDITIQMKQLQLKHSTRVNSVFGRDLHILEQQIEQQTSYITQQFHLAERTLHKVGTMTKRTGNGQDITVGSNIQRSLAKRLQELSVSFRQSQRRYLAEVQTQKSGGTSSSKFSMIQFDTTSSSTSNGMSDTSQNENNNFFTSQQMAVVDDLTSIVQGRDEEIIKIAQSIEELGTIFKELAVLVIDQGTVLDRIDYNMETIVDHTQTGVQQLIKAEQTQKNARPLRCIICLSCIIFTLLIILIMKHRPRHGWL